MLFWDEFAPFADKVRPELFADTDLWLVWHAAAAYAGDITAVPPYLQARAIEAVEAYQGATPEVLIATLEDAIPRRRLHKIAVEIIDGVDAGKDVAEVIGRAKDKLSEMESDD